MSLQKPSTKLVDIVTNGCAGVQLAVGIGFMFDSVDWKHAIALFAASAAVSSYMNGKGVPTLPEIMSAFNSQTMK